MAHTPQIHIPWLHEALRYFFGEAVQVNPQWEKFAAEINILEPQDDFRALNEHLESVTFLEGEQLRPEDLYVLCRVRLCPAWKRVITNKNRPPYLARWYLHVNSLLPDQGLKPDYKERVHFDLRMHAAIEADDLELAQRLLKVVNLQERDPQNRGVQAIHVAAMKGNFAAIEMLLDQGVPVDSEDSEGMTALFYAAYRGKLDLLQYLLSKGANASHIEHQGRTAVYWAANTGKIEALKLLIAHGCDPNVKTRLGRSALSKAAWSGQVEVVKVLCESPMVRLDEGDGKGRTPLHNAVWGESGGRAGKKLAFGNISDSPECADVIITHLQKRGLSIDLQDRSGNTPLCIAASTNAPKSVSLLLKRGANALHSNRYRNTPLHEAVRRGHLACAALLIDFGISPELPGFNGFSPLQTTIYCDQLVMCRYLLSLRGVHIDISAIFLCVECGRGAILKLLLERYTGELPIELLLKAIQTRKNEIFGPVLKRYSGEIDFSVLKEAASYCSAELFSELLEKTQGDIPQELFISASANPDLGPLSLLLSKASVSPTTFLTIVNSSPEPACLIIVEKMPVLWSAIDEKTGETPLHRACFRGFSLLTDKLLTESGEHCCNYIAQKDNFGVIAHTNAVMNRHVSIAAYLEDLYRQGKQKPLETCIVSLAFSDLLEPLDPNPIPESEYPSTYLSLDLPWVPLDQASVEVIDTPERLAALEELSLPWKAVGLDMEYFSFDEKRGVISLLQLSDGLQDYILDPLRCSVAGFLQRLMRRKDCIKVLHGADSDLIWLQLNYSAYSVNVFDTARAHRVVAKEPGLSSLARLLELYLGISLEKVFQLADWRIRPLPPPMLKYAREDAHYLLRLYTVLLSHMDEENLLETANLCNKLCRKQPSAKHQRVQVTLVAN